MINSKNQQLLFELLYKYWILMEEINQVDEYISYLREELSTIEATDLASTNPDDFQGELGKDWLHFLQYKQNGKNLGTTSLV